LSSLQFLYVGRNSLSRLPESLGKLRKLQELDVVRSGALQLPTSLGDLPRLELVYIDNRTTPFYQNPAYQQYQRIIVIERESQYPYRSSHF
jgi:Leucine-rich repeat (LRR) protein